MRRRLIVYPILCACLYGALWFYARRSLYFPMRHPAGYWDLQSQVPATDVWLRTADGKRIHGWWAEAPGARSVTLFLHGNAGNVTHRAPHMAMIASAGSSVLVIDYRGYGKSEGSPSESGLYADADAAYAYLRAMDKPIVVHGESLGTAVAVNLASRRTCAGVVLEAPFTSARAMAARMLPVLGPLVMSGFDSLARIKQINAPLLVIHGDQDEIVPFDLGRELFAAAREPKAFWDVKGAGHNNIVETAGATYRDRLREFYRTLEP